MNELVSKYFIFQNTKYKNRSLNPFRVRIMEEQLANTKARIVITKVALGEMDWVLMVYHMIMELRTQVTSSKDRRWVELVTTTLTKQVIVQTITTVTMRIYHLNTEMSLSLRMGQSTKVSGEGQ
jgi:hypothetical protein